MVWVLLLVVVWINLDRLVWVVVCISVSILCVVVIDFSCCFSVCMYGIGLIVVVMFLVVVNNVVRCLCRVFRVIGLVSIWFMLVCWYCCCVCVCMLVVRFMIGIGIVLDVCLVCWIVLVSVYLFIIGIW